MPLLTKADQELESFNRKRLELKAAKLTIREKSTPVKQNAVSQL
jgi:hypothetical protein